MPALYPALLLPAGAKVSKNPAAYNKNMIAMQRNDSVPAERKRPQ
jgi:hypothetical protein